MKRLALEVKEYGGEYIIFVEDVKRLKFRGYVEKDGVRGAQFFKYAEDCYDVPQDNETFDLFPGDVKEWSDWGTTISGPSEWSCEKTNQWHIKLIEVEE